MAVRDDPSRNCSQESLLTCPFPAWIYREALEEFIRITATCFHSVAQLFIVRNRRATAREGCIEILCATIEPEQIPCGMIEGASKIMNGVSYDQMNVRREGCIKINMEESVTIGIQLRSKGIDVTFFVGIEGCL